jgi:hypothetical protein
MFVTGIQQRFLARQSYGIFKNQFQQNKRTIKSPTIS